MFPSQLTAFLSVAFSVFGAVATRHYEIVNLCESPIEVFINDESQGTIADSTNITRELDDSFDGFIYTLANGGNNDGTHLGRAGFHGETNTYFILIDVNHLNTGISIAPINKTATGGFCGEVRCDSVACSTAFTKAPVSFPPPIAGVPSKVPLHECPDQNTGFTVTFCPAFGFGPFLNVPVTFLHPDADINKCLDVRGAVYANGTPVQIYDCNGTGAQRWVVDRGPTKVRVNGTDFCLDAGQSPGNGVGMKIWQCFDGLPAQAWYYTLDNHLAVENKGLCLDLTNGIAVNANQVQTWQCTDGNTNQIWSDSGLIAPP